jgi:hypothetical protein
VRATSTEAQLRDNSVLTQRVCEVDGSRTGASYVPGLNISRVMTALMVGATRPEPDVARPGYRSRPGRPFAPQTQYKCGKSGIWNNHPLGKPRYDQRLLLAPASRLRWIELAVETSLSNGAHMLVHSAADGSTKTGHPRDGMAAAGSVPNRGPEGMTRASGNEVMRRAGTTGAEAG